MIRALVPLNKRIVMEVGPFNCRGRQKSNFDFGHLVFLHDPWRCQKHPCTKITLPRLGNTMSGLPGRSRACKRYRYPIPCTRCRTSISGFVSFPLTRLIRWLRSAAVKVSISLTTVLWQRPSVSGSEAKQQATRWRILSICRVGAQPPSSPVPKIEDYIWCDSKHCGSRCRNSATRTVH